LAALRWYGFSKAAPVRIAIHPNPRSFADRWLHYLAEHEIPHTVVNALGDDIVAVMGDHDLLLWNWNIGDPAGLLHAQQVLAALEWSGKAVFPDLRTAYHYDDKIAQKYLLEAVDAPRVRTYVHYHREAAHAWADETEFPKVFKLRRGAGGSNVQLVPHRRAAHRIIATMFGAGRLATASYAADFRTKARRVDSFQALSRRVVNLPRALRSIRKKRDLLPRERGYTLFQDFLPGNDFDTRIVVIGGKAFGIKRMNRPGEFRASGSGRIIYDHRQIAPEFVAIAFDLSRRLSFQCMAYDFLRDGEGRPAICEISYCWAPGDVYFACEGWWGEDLRFHPGHAYLEDVILASLLGENRAG
jgi:glutathione synthase/RimK-type ligase-like ATP-grasp enzyme